MNRVQIYETKSRKTFVAAPVGTPVPTGVASQFGITKLFKILDLDDPRKPIALDKEQVARDIATNGYTILSVSMEFTVGVPSAAR